ncbi:hypothetical protein ACFQZC_17215 [Streptacidiphilus monticola]
MNRRLVNRRLLLLFQLRWWLRLLRREAWRGLVASGVWYGTVGPEILPSVLPGGDGAGRRPGIRNGWSPRSRPPHRSRCCGCSSRRRAASAPAQESLKRPWRTSVRPGLAAHRSVDCEETRTTLNSTRTFTELVLQRTADLGEKDAFIFLHDSAAASDAERLTYDALDGEAKRIASWLQQRGASGGQVLLLYPPGWTSSRRSRPASTPARWRCPLRCPATRGATSPG